MKTPERMSDADFVELEKTVTKYPYFQCGHSTLARASRSLKKQNATKKLSTAATYATSRTFFKLYIQGKIRFAPSQIKETVPIVKPAITHKPSREEAPLKTPTLLSDKEQSSLIAELYDNLERRKSSRNQYIDYNKNHPEETFSELEAPAQNENVPESDVPVGTLPIEQESKTPPIDSVQKLKDQVAEEVEAEEKSISEAISEIGIKDIDTQASREEKIIEPKEEELTEVTKKTKTSDSTFEISADELTEIVDAESDDTTIKKPSERPIENNIKNESEDQIVEIEKAIEKDFLEHETNAKNTPKKVKIELDSIEKEDIEETKEEAKEDSVIDLSISIDPADGKSTEEELSKIDKETQELKLTPRFSPTGKKFRMGSLKMGINFTKPKAKKSAVKSTSKKTGSKKSSTRGADISEEKKKPKKGIREKFTSKKTSKDQKQIIDSFIELSPRIEISKGKVTEETPVENLAVNSGVFPDDIVTENLAAIFKRQGKNEYAILMYEKLILKNPQKKAYFVSQIEKIKKK